MFGTAGLPHILMRFYTVPDARAARTSVFFATGLIGLFYLLTFVLGFGAMVLVGPEAIRAVDPGGNMAAPLLAELLGRHAVPRLHRRGGVRDHPRGGRRPHALRRGGAVARSLGERGARGARRSRGSSSWSPGSPRSRSASSRSRSASRSRDRTSPSWCRSPSRSRRAPTFRRSSSRSSGAATPRPAPSPAWPPGTVLTLLLIYLSPTIQVDILGHDAAWFPLKNPALITMPLSFAGGHRGVVGGSRASAAAGYAALERRMHLGGDQ